MQIILLIALLLLPAFCSAYDFKDFDIEKVHVEKAIAPALAWAIASFVFSVGVSVMQYIQARKAQKKNNQAISQIDGTITGEGTISHDIAGSPHMYGNDVEIWNQSTIEIKQKSGGKK